MFKQIKKQKKAKSGAVIVADEQVTCGACGHVRQDSDANPEWQCPCCQAAYAKVNKVKIESGYSKRKLRAKNHAFLHAKATNIEHSSAEEDMPGWMSGVLTGLGTLVVGAGSACAAANPFVLGAGALIVVGSIGYALLKIFS